jgi:hypothetical protein
MRARPLRTTGSARVEPRGPRSDRSFGGAARDSVPEWGRVALPSPASRARAPRRGRRTELAVLVAGGRLTPGTLLHGIHRGGNRHEARVDADGLLWLTERDRFRLPDEAGRMATGLKRCQGWKFLHVTLADGRAVLLSEFRDDPRAHRTACGRRSHRRMLGARPRLTAAAAIRSYSDRAIVWGAVEAAAQAIEQLVRDRTAEKQPRQTRAPGRACPGGT